MAVKSRFAYERNLYQKPQINLARSSGIRIWMVNATCFAVILQSSLTDSFSSMTVALGAVTAALITELFFLRNSDKSGSLLDGSAIAAALVMTLFLPNNISPFYAAIGSVFAIAIVKHSFGGLGSVWLNPAIGGWLFIRFSWAEQFNRAMESSYLTLSINGSGFFPINSSLDGTVLPFLNRTLFSISSTGFSEGYLGLLNSPYAGIIADRGALSLLLGTILIIVFRAGRSWVPLLYLLVFCFFYRLRGAIPYGGNSGEGDLFYVLFTGGTWAAAFFLAAETGGGAKSRLGVLALTVFGAFAAFLFRSSVNEAYGVVYAALLISTITPLVRIMENRVLSINRIKARSGANYV